MSPPAYTPQSKWAVVAYAAFLVVTHPLVEVVHYRRLLDSGALSPDADAIGLPIAQSITGLAILLPFIAGFLAFALSKYPGRTPLIFWNARRPIWSWTWTAVFAAALIAALPSAVADTRNSYWLDALQATLIAHLLLILRVTLVARRV